MFWSMEVWRKGGEGGIVGDRGESMYAQKNEVHQYNLKLKRGIL